MKRSHVVGVVVLGVITLSVPVGARSQATFARAEPKSGPPGTLVTLVGTCGPGLAGETFLPVVFHEGTTTVPLSPGVGAVDGNFGPQAATVTVPGEARAGAAQFEVQCPAPTGSLFADFTVTSPSVPRPVAAVPRFTG